MTLTVLTKKHIISIPAVTAVATMDQEVDIPAILAAKNIDNSYWTLDKIYVTFAAAYTGTLTFTVDVDDEVNEIDRAKTSSSIAAETDVEISDLGLDARTRDKLVITSSAALTVGTAFLYITLLISL